MLPECGDFLYTEFGTIQLMEDPKLYFEEFEDEFSCRQFRSAMYLANAVMDEEKYRIYWKSINTTISDPDNFSDCDWNDYVVIKTN